MAKVILRKFEIIDSAVAFSGMALVGRLVFDLLGLFMNFLLWMTGLSKGTRLSGVIADGICTVIMFPITLMIALVLGILFNAIWFLLLNFALGKSGGIVIEVE